MNIASLVVHTRPEHGARTAQRLLELPGVEIHASTAEGRLVVTVEDDDGHAAAETLNRIHSLEGVLSAALTFQYSDDGIDTQGSNGHEAQSA